MTSLVTKPVVLIAEELSPATVEALGPDFEIRSCNGADRAELLYRRGRCHLALGRAQDAASDLQAHLATGESPHESEIAELLAVRPG